ncbi:DUF6507 family protein [Dermabacter vaginalis]|uniref:DUF6507 family protein n=1 Tax=Dermabacter vaginalis TaxID=1630135 RepID=UPI000802AB5F|nr:DUF6507 family protein [Dermabacter vaginalis]
MQYDIQPNAVGIIIGKARQTVDQLEAVSGATDSAISDAGSALTHSPAASSAVQHYLEVLVKFGVDGCHDLAQHNILCTDDACRSYLEGDAQAASNSQTALASVPEIDSPGA